jgi:hypothetical protein
MPWSDRVTRSAIQPAIAPISNMVKKPTPGWLKKACASFMLHLPEGSVPDARISLPKVYNPFSEMSCATGGGRLFPAEGRRSGGTTCPGKVRIA